MGNDDYSSPFNPKQIERETKNRLLRTSVISLIIVSATLLFSIFLFPRATFLQPTAETGEPLNRVDWSLLEGLASLVTVSLVLGGLAFAFTEYVQTTIQQKRESAEASFNIYKEVYEKLMNPAATNARRWIILNLPVREKEEADQSWLQRTTAILNESPDDREGDRPPGLDYLKEVLNTFDFIGFVSKNYWNMDLALVSWMSPVVTKVWDRIYLYVEDEVKQRNEPDFYESAREFCQDCVEWRRNQNLPQANIFPGAT
jgi:hypothetical protein